MENQVEKWAKDTFMAATKDTFGFSKIDVEQVISNCLDLKGTNELLGYFEGFLGFEGSLKFVEELEKRREKEKISVKGVWKSNSLNVVQLIQQQMGISEPQAEDIIDQLKTISLDRERREYLESMIGKGFEAERIFILLSKMIAKEQEDRKMTEKAKKKKTKQKDVKVKFAEKVGNKSWCECMATVHDLLQNCLHCGKIICTFEGDEICPFCKKIPGEGLEILPGYEESLKRTNTLIDYQTNSAARTFVHDNAADFDIGADEYNKWISAEERAIVLKKRQNQEREEEEAKSRRVITLDLENNRVLVEKSIVPNKELTQKSNLEQINQPPAGVFRNPNLKNRVATFIPSKKPVENKKKPQVKMDWDLSRLQDYVY
jgi:hypothetical protein